MNSDSEEAEQFFKAVNNNDRDKVDELLSTGSVEINLRNCNEYDRTALHIAAHKGHCELACLLVEKYHADVNAVDNKGLIPLQLATDRYYMKIVKFLLKRNSNLREYAARHLNTDQVEELFEATEVNNINRVAELINEGVDVNSEDRSDFERTALEVAATRGYYDLVQLLVDNGADLDHEDNSGESAYHKAINNNHENIANFLVDRGFKNTEYVIDVSDNENDSDDFQLSFML